MTKNLFLVVFASFLFTASLHAQSVGTVARNWTMTDCAGVDHTLYDELDSGNVVVMDFAMTYMGGTTVCPSCSTATDAIQKLHSQLELKYPGKIRHYALAYSDTYDCNEMSQWEDQCGFSLPSFLQCETEMKHYAPSGGMPLIVIVAGKDHKQIYFKTSFTKRDTTTIKNAIQNALATASVDNSAIPSESISIEHVEAGIALNMNLASQQTLTVEVYDILGRLQSKVATNRLFQAGANSVPLPMQGVATGAYIVRVTSQSGMVITKPFSV